MLTLTGKYNTAKIFTDNVEASAVAQIIELCNQPFVQDSQLRIMPDVHAGISCVIGTTMTLHGRVVPNLVGVDLGCGVSATKLLVASPDLAKLDQTIRVRVPAGFATRNTPHDRLEQTRLDELCCLSVINRRRADLSVGTLGGGNHFIEVDRDSAGAYWLVVHSGSRNLGKQVAEHYQSAAVKQVRTNRIQTKQELVDRLRAEGRTDEIYDANKAAKNDRIPPHLCYAEGDLYDDYLHDMAIAQEYAQQNRDAMADEIVRAMGWEVTDQFTTVHNYIDVESKILRKGAVAAYAGQRLLIPLNMRDGVLLCTGKGNADWNFSAPHGAGRLMGRGAAKRALTVEDFRTAMNGIFTTSVGYGTLDEAPGAYKPAAEILAYIGDTVDVLDTWKPVYNFKA